MFGNNSDLLSQIDAIIQTDSLDEKKMKFDASSILEVMQNAKTSPNKNYLYFVKKPHLQKLEERIEKLEAQNDQLLYIIYSLFQRVLKIRDQLTKSSTRSNEETANCAYNLNNDIKKSSENFQSRKKVLTKREMDVFLLLEKGLCAKEIAKVLFISETTVITHKKNLKEKFNAKNTVELISKVLATLA